MSVNLITPAHGTGLIHRGEQSLTSRQYAQMAAREKLPPLFRGHARIDVYEHRFASCEHHVMVPAGSERMSLKDIRKTLLPKYRLKPAPWSHHVHSLDWRLQDDRWVWSCACGQHGSGDYDEGVFEIAEGLVHYRCLRCGTIRSFPAISGGAGNTYYVDAVNGADANTGGSSDPFRTLNKLRTTMVAGNADIGRLRGADGVSNTYYQEGFSSSTPFPGGTSDVTRTIVEADSGVVFNSQLGTITTILVPSTPVIRPTSGSRVIHMAGTTQRYVTFRGIVFDGQFVSGAVLKFDPDAHHVRFHGGSVRLTPATGVDVAEAENLEFIDMHIYQNGLADPRHGISMRGVDNLVEGCHIYQNSGYGIQIRSIVASEVADRCVYRANIIRNNAAGGVQYGNATDPMFYNNLVYDNGGYGLNAARDQV